MDKWEKRRKTERNVTREEEEKGARDSKRKYLPNNKNIKKQN